MIHTSCLPQHMTQACLIKGSHQLYLSSSYSVLPIRQIKEQSHGIPHVNIFHDQMFITQESSHMLRISISIFLGFAIELPVRLIRVALQCIGDASLTKPKKFQFSRSLNFSNTTMYFIWRRACMMQSYQCDAISARRTLYTSTSVRLPFSWQIYLDDVLIVYRRMTITLKWVQTV